MTTSSLVVLAASLLVKTALCQESSLVCEMNGSLDLYLDWYDFNQKFHYTESGHVQFNYNITYSQRDSEANPVIILLYKQVVSVNKSESTCLQKLRRNSYNDLSFLMITLDKKNFWSGCEHTSDSDGLITCVGGRNFASVRNTTFAVAATRCGSQRIQLREYTLGFEGYSGECLGTLNKGESESEPFSKNLTIVTIICVINSAILVTVVIFLVCRKWRMLKKESSGEIYEMR